MARPTKLTDDVIAKAEEYALDHRVDGSDDVLPTIEGLALYLGVNRSTVYDWSKLEGKFPDIFADVLAKQAKSLVNKGLTGDYAPTITKVMLTKHGYRDGQDIDHTSSDSSMQPTVIQFVGPDSQD